MTNAEIIETAMLVLAVDKAPDDAALRARLEAALDQMNIRDHGCLQLAIRMLEGRRYCINSDNPDSLRRARSLAADLGAGIEDITGDVEGAIGELMEKHRISSVLFTPPTKS